MGIINWSKILYFSIRMLVLFVAFFGIIYLAGKADSVLSSDGACTYCHSMRYAAAELKKSAHYGTLGIDPGCADCHLPAGLYGRFKAHFFDGARSLYGEIFHDTNSVEKYELYRDEQAHRARVRIKQLDSSPCRSCHKNPRPFAGRGKEEHLKLKSGKFTCIDCHQNLVHKPTPVEDIGRGMREGRIVAAEGAYIDMQAR